MKAVASHRTPKPSAPAAMLPDLARLRHELFPKRVHVRAAEFLEELGPILARVDRDVQLTYEAGMFLRFEPPEEGAGDSVALFVAALLRVELPLLFAGLVLLVAHVIRDPFGEPKLAFAAVMLHHVREL